VSSKALIVFDTLVLTISGLGTRDAAVEAGRLVTAHLDAIQNGQAVRFRANQYDILQTIDIPLSQAVDKLIDQGIVAIKTGLQDILRDPLGLNIGFLFQKEPPFREGIAVLRASGENDLAQYLEDVRVGWLSHFQKLRNQHEHHGWSLGCLQYQRAGPSAVVVNLPTILRLPVDQYARRTANGVLLFLENVMVYAMQRHWQCQYPAFEYPVFVAEIPEDQRDPQNPQRFQLAARGLHPTPPWAISYSEDTDFV
jgi:hypothetical protein